MNEKPIQKGDLVIVVRDCCGLYVGHPFRVGGLHKVALPTWLSCAACGHGYSNITYASSDNTSTYVQNASLHWLKKIDGPIESETYDTKEELHA